jgi:glycosyltransferase involved in cell wall biosynthesis
MKLLIVTQKIDKNDDILGFFHEWVTQFAKHYQSVLVTALEVGEYDLPNNVEVVSLEKTETTTSRDIALRFLGILNSRKKDYDVVFVHMNPEYVAIGGALLRILGKRVALWYTHSAVTTKLKIAEKFANVIFTASGQGFRVPTRKLRIVGHGVNINRFQCTSGKSPEKLNILSVGRITRIKKCDVLLRAALLMDRYRDRLKVTFVGGPMNSEDEAYFTELKALVEELKITENVEFLGRIPNIKTPRLYCDATLTVNLTSVGSIDKTVLESMASKTPVLTSNESFRVYFEEHANDLIFAEDDERDLSSKITALYEREDIDIVTDFLYEQAQKHFNVENLITKIVQEL